MKEEPEHYSYEQLENDHQTIWAGVKNPLAQKHLRSIRKGDRIFYYHTGNQKAVVGVAEAAGDAYPDPKVPTGKLYAVDIVPVGALPRPVTLAEIKSDGRFADFPLVRISRLSVMPVSKTEWARIEKMSRDLGSMSSRGRRCYRGGDRERRATGRGQSPFDPDFTTTFGERASRRRRRRAPQRFGRRQPRPAIPRGGRVRADAGSREAGRGDSRGPAPPS